MQNINDLIQNLNETHARTEEELTNDIRGLHEFVNAYVAATKDRQENFIHVFHGFMNEIYDKIRHGYPPEQAATQSSSVVEEFEDLIGKTALANVEKQG